MTKKEEVKAKIQALVPEIIHIVTLADVLLAYKILMETDRPYPRHYYMTLHHVAEYLLINNWDLAQPYDNQPEEVYEFLHNILID